MLLTRLLTKNLQIAPLLRIDFNIETINGLCDYIRENYNMKDII